MLRYVQGDSRPPIQVSLEAAGEPIDVSSAGITVSAYLRKVGATAVVAILIGTKVTGRLTSVDPDTCAWVVDQAAPYNVAGFGGIVIFNPMPSTFLEAGQYEAEYEINYGAGVTQTVQKIDQIVVRPQIG